MEVKVAVEKCEILFEGRSLRYLMLVTPVFRGTAPEAEPHGWHIERRPADLEALREHLQREPARDADGQDLALPPVPSAPFLVPSQTGSQRAVAEADHVQKS